MNPEPLEKRSIIDGGTGESSDPSDRPIYSNTKRIGVNDVPSNAGMKLSAVFGFIPGILDLIRSCACRFATDLWPYVDAAIPVLMRDIRLKLKVGNRIIVLAGRKSSRIEPYGLRDRFELGPLVVKIYEPPVSGRQQHTPYVLGISGTWHDAAACLFKDGVLIAALEEERLTRIKHDASLIPENSIRRLLE